MELDDLYQELILDHYKRPRNSRKLEDAEVLVDEENPTCGDHLRLTARVEGGRIADVKFEAKGCAISVSSASMMTERLIGLPVEEGKRVAADFIAFMRGEKELSADELGELAALEGVKKYPLRVKCATLGWHAIQSALERTG